MGSDTFDHAAVSDFNMEKRQLLFATYRENLKEGVSYVIELAKAIDQDIMILFVQKPANLKSKFDRLMTAVTFAEAGEHDTARNIAAEASTGPNEDSDQDIDTVVNNCLRAGVRASVHKSPLEAMSGIRSFIKAQSGIDKVVLSPAITMADDITSKEIKRLVRIISRPVVTMAPQTLAVEGGVQKA